MKQLHAVGTDAAGSGPATGQINQLVSVVYVSHFVPNTYLTRGGATGRGIGLESGRSRVLFPSESLKLFIDLILPTTLWPTKPLTGMSTRNISWGVNTADV